MAFDMTINNKHAVCFPSKVLSGQSGHIYNIYLEDKCDNGVIVGKGAWKDFDRYEATTAPTFEGVIREQAADGNWYVEVTKFDPQNPAILIYEVPIIAENYDYRFQDLAGFYNAAESTVRGYSLTVGDIFELSDAGFTGTPAPGKKVTVSGKKLAVSAS